MSFLTATLAVQICIQTRGGSKQHDHALPQPQPLLLLLLLLQHRTLARVKIYVVLQIKAE